MKKLVSETRVWFGTLGWACGYAVATQVPKHGWIAMMIGLLVYIILYLILAVILEMNYAHN